MSSKPIVLDPDIQRLQDEGYEVEVRNGHLLVHGVPYVDAHRRVQRGIVVTDLNGNLGRLGPPANHQVWFVGDFPCKHTGEPIEGIRHSSAPYPLWEGLVAQHRFSNKPKSGYPDYHSKMKSYVDIISNEARFIDPEAKPCTFKVIVSTDPDMPFCYWDSASSRSGTLAAAEKFKGLRIAIVGLGGTGSYILDLVSKTMVREIHLFDGDVIKQYNAFRSPGAASEEVLEAQPPKVKYLAGVYGAMHTGIVPHHVYLTEDNIELLNGFDFVFICVDKGPVRRLISRSLKAQGTPFIDVGMNMQMLPEERSLIGTYRATLSTPEKNDHFEKHADMSADMEDDLYHSNIQVAEMNAANAAMAVMMWKQHVGYYQNVFRPHHTTFSINAHSLTREEETGMTKE